MTGAEFAKLSGVSAATLSHALTRGRVGDPTLRKFARFLTVTPPVPGADALIAQYVPKGALVASPTPTPTEVVEARP